jgi:integrase
MTTALATRPLGKLARKNGRVKQKWGNRVARRLPEYLEPQEVTALLHQGRHAQARLVMLCQWRAGLRVSEALALEVSDLNFSGDNPTLRIRKGKGDKMRLVPLHPELAAAFRNFLDYSDRRRGRIFSACRSTAWRWVQEAMEKAQQLNQIPPGKQVGTHTLRHSAARHWLASGVPINHVSRWLGLPASPQR